MSKSTPTHPLRVIAFLAAVVFLQALAPGSLLAGVQPDPECEQACHDTYVTCYYDYCDQRGDCSYCWTDYQSCVSFCPQICVEPRSVRDYTQTFYVNVQITQTTGCFRGINGVAVVHNKINYQKRTDSYRETTHCDGSKTTQFLGSTTSGPLVCWRALAPLQSCSSNNIAPICPF